VNPVHDDYVVNTRPRIFYVPSVIYVVNTRPRIFYVPYAIYVVKLSFMVS
jgi:hypothetical protein